MAVNNLQFYVTVINKLSLAEKSESVFEELTTAFRYLRNICAEGSHIQNNITSDNNILCSTGNILNEIASVEEWDDSARLCLLVGLQFIANLLVNNFEVQKRVWKYENLLKRCLKFGDSKIQNCAAMILYNIFLGHPEYITLEKDLIEDITPLTTNEVASEFALYLLQLFVTKANVHEVYETLKSTSKSLILEAIQDLNKNCGENLRPELMNFFVTKFTDSSDAILNNLESSFEVYEVVKILEMLSCVSSVNENNLKFLQSQKSLLVNCLLLLKSIHALSKEPGNNFSMIQKLSELTEIEKNAQVQDHPYFGLKCSLIRLIGNLCWKNAECQNEVRELGILPVLLDCCNIDGRNPFIIQWTIFAIRNICENNKDNQQYISDLPKSGTVDIAKLEKMGILLNRGSDGNSLSISPLEFKK